MVDMKPHIGQHWAELEAETEGRMAAVELHDVRKSFGSVAVLHGVDLSFADGEFVVLLGPSGCGKSTLLRLIAGLEDTDSGEIRIEGQNVTSLEPRSRGVAMVFQSYALYPHMTVAKNMSFALRLGRRSPREIAERVGEASQMLELQDYLDRYPRQLSGGQRQRVAMGRAIVRDPKVFLFDEPLSNLDAKLRVQMRIEIKKLHQRLRNTAIYVTHDQMEAMTMADRVVVMRAGKVEQVGTPLEIYDRPANDFVAQFIGSPVMNFIPGRLEQAGGGVDFVSDGIRVPVNPTDSRSREVWLGIRPEHVTLSPHRDGVPCEVTLVEPLGRETLIYGRVGASEICIAPSRRADFHPGAIIHLDLPPDHLHLFDRKTGARL
jgi:multiple sugar transport system ATP-binding protein